MTSSVNSTDDIDLSAGVLVKGIELDANTYFVSTNFQTLRAITRNPVLLQRNKRARPLDPEIEQEQDIHELIQRALTGSKKSNAEKYRRYIEGIVNGTSIGVLPPMHLWCRELLKQVQNQRGTFIIVPHGDKLLAIDGETQLTAHWKLDSDQNVSPEQRQRHRQLPLGAVIHHGIDTQHARQYFHDLNVLAVRPNTSLSLGMDTHDPITRIVDDIETKVPALTGRVEKQARQLTKASNKIVTLQNLRQMVINTAKGISGIQYGARPVPLDDVDVSELAKVATGWIDTYFDTYFKEITARDTYLASSGAVLAAVGAMGHQLLEASTEERRHVADELLTMLKDVDWSKGEHWSGIAGNITSRGVFSVKGTKEVAYAVHTALTDPTSASYQAVRHMPSAPVAGTRHWE